MFDVEFETSDGYVDAQATKSATATIAQSSGQSNSNLEAPIQLQETLTAGQLAYANLNKVRTDAEKYLSTVFARGRKAKLELVGKIYAEYFVAIANGVAAAVVAKIEEQLKADEIAFRSNTPNATKLVRFVFATYNKEELTNKEAFQYSRALDVALDLGKQPDVFEQFVLENGGFAGIMQNYPVSRAAAKATGNTTGASKLDKLRQVATASELPIDDWADGEEYRVYIAIRSDDSDDGLLKVVQASKEAVEKFIAICEAERNAAKKPAKDAAKKQKKSDKLLLDRQQQFSFWPGLI